jgi:hypothetical protein
MAKAATERGSKYLKTLGEIQKSYSQRKINLTPTPRLKGACSWLQACCLYFFYGIHVSIKLRISVSTTASVKLDL